MRPGLPLPTTSIVAVIVGLGLVLGVVLGATRPVPVEDVREAPQEPGIANIGGDEPPMEYTPQAESSSRRPPTSTVVPTSAPPHVKPVVTPESTPEMSVARTTAVPLPQLPTLSNSSAPPSSPTVASESPSTGIGA